MESQGEIKIVKTRLSFGQGVGVTVFLLDYKPETPMHQIL